LRNESSVISKDKNITVKKILPAICAISLSISCGHADNTNAPTKKPVNLLFIMTDQQRWDAMSCYGNTVIKPPHFDKTASERARFASFCSVCLR
jgi:hypothetical protein